ncbi:putative transmembrane protein [Rhodovulum sp. PH10]|uniref:sodium:proton antiporter n=1 Tax=Rhodovulum sp. PH10 TaxID=1187851 RepID=UPI00027C273F|nr:sodium:proton antiporter [Rhodovulum sp. PH10]EJW12993.1 putative transmembrane protein [Rhodovulum sp. PH10]
MKLVGVAGVVVFTLITSPVFAAEGPHLDGANLDLLWGVPFVGILMSIALFPLIAPHVWEHHFGKIATLWGAAFLLPCAALIGPTTAATELWHTAALEYVPFIILLFSLFVVAGGICISGSLVGTPAVNTTILGIGTIAASFLGTTGASMLLIRPLIRANQARPTNAHVFVFFVFLVSNIGGSLTPLGDPPLFLGFLKGVDFLWTGKALIGPMAFASGILLMLFFLIDTVLWRRARITPVPAPEPVGAAATDAAPAKLRMIGGHNIGYLGGIVAAVLMSGVWESGIEVPVGLGVTVPLEGLARDVVLLAISLASWLTTRKSIRVENAFAWTPIQEVAILFAGIFITIIPVLAILRAGSAGHLASLVALVSHPDGSPNDAAYFWITGGLSSFLDNAPTYLVFFNLAGGDPATLMGPLHTTLVAISAGAVFMGANSYIGNAPNFMVKAICAERGIAMPSFFGYMLWSGGILLPLFGLITWVFFL